MPKMQYRTFNAENSSAFRYNSRTVYHIRQIMWQRWKGRGSCRMNGKVGRHMKINRRSQRIKKYRAMHRQKKKWLTAVAWLAAVVLLCTTYMPVMPAFTLEADQTLSCTYEAHRHQ